MNRVVHFEIHAADQDKVQKFYQEVFGWDIKATGSEYGGYRMVMTGPGGMDAPDPKDPGINGGITARKGALPVDGQAVNAFVCIIGVDNIDTSIQKILAAGGTEALTKMDVPNVGLLAYYKDPEGTLFGILQPAPMQK